ncbi:MAG: UDP-N-acetylmuramate--L-alanine ligase, partial [Bacteroidetes bacterium HGW-Bacteroidetes-15]
YDSTPSKLTHQLEQEGISVHYTDSVNSIPKDFIDNPKESLVIYTPAIPKNHIEYNYFLNNGYEMTKRAKDLGCLSKSCVTAAVSGTHGKTSTSTLLAHLLASTPQGCNAFLGGISKNFLSNLVLADKGANRLVVEADEFDRSFHHLTPQLAIVTSIDADHLDIYKTHQEVKLAFAKFIDNITPGGVLIIKKGLEDIAKSRDDIKKYSYSSTEEADFFAKNITNTNGHYKFDLVTPFGQIEDITLGVLGRYNVENAIAASAAAILWGIDSKDLINGLKSFRGIVRRFDLQFKGNKFVYIDDYAHHPEEINAAVSSVREMFPSKKITGVFQPHLYSRTNDFADGFAQSLSLLDEVIVLDIYPAREEPIPGVTSEVIINKITCQNKRLCKIDNLIDCLKNSNFDVLITMGAGNIDRVVTDIVKLLEEKEKEKVK